MKLRYALIVILIILSMLLVLVVFGPARWAGAAPIESPVMSPPGAPAGCTSGGRSWTYIESTGAAIVARAADCVWSEWSGDGGGGGYNYRWGYSAWDGGASGPGSWDRFPSGYPSGQNEFFPLAAGGVHAGVNSSGTYVGCSAPGGGCVDWWFLPQEAGRMVKVWYTVPGNPGATQTAEAQATETAAAGATQTAAAGATYTAIRVTETAVAASTQTAVAGATQTAAAGATYTAIRVTETAAAEQTVIAGGSQPCGYGDLPPCHVYWLTPGPVYWETPMPVEIVGTVVITGNVKIDNWPTPIPTPTFEAAVERATAIAIARVSPEPVVIPGASGPAEVFSIDGYDFIRTSRYEFGCPFAALGAELCFEYVEIESINLGPWSFPLWPFGAFFMAFIIKFMVQR